MNGEHELRRLAGALGVPATYRDATGRMRDVPAASLRAMCAALGFEATDDAAADLRWTQDGVLPGQPDDGDEKLRRLHRLRQEGLISEEEYQRERKEVLDQN